MTKPDPPYNAVVLFSIEGWVNFYRRLFLSHFWTLFPMTETNHRQVLLKKIFIDSQWIQILRLVQLMSTHTLHCKCSMWCEKPLMLDIECVPFAAVWWEVIDSTNVTILLSSGVRFSSLHECGICGRQERSPESSLSSWRGWYNNTKKRVRHSLLVLH